MAKFDRNAGRKKRHLRIRNKVAGTSERPRLNVYKSNANMYAQIIDDSEGRTLVSASTLQDSVDGHGSNIESAQAVGKAIAERALEKGITTVVFDRSGYIYHGKVKALADAAREAGLKL
ncbi:50S ribosomal protein L18 [Kallipyga massiliensis]|uniref:50S ribosomal protein L18 n=1 Tax=Kallipyga massiliensis TaxID=1472764 RepID=UPI000562A546|nr:50S ribosomal protein L18 [Kallipyga massiliensis]